MRQPLHDAATGVNAASGESTDIGALTRRLAAGDEAAYRMFFELYLDRLTRYLLVVTAGDEQATRDALQETLTRIVRHVKAFTHEEVFWSWLTVLARSAFFDLRRKRRRYLAFLDRFTRFGIIPDDHGNGNGDADGLGQVLQRQMQQLPPDEHELLEWKYFERASVREIAGRMGETEKAIESRLGRIRRKLKDAIVAELKHGPRT